LIIGIVKGTRHYRRMRKWKFWIDCGGTFSDFVAVSGEGLDREIKVHKVLSHSPHYESAVVKGIEDVLGHDSFKEAISEIRLGTTVATNAFLERKGIPCVLVTTQGHSDLLEIRQQNRPELFDLNIKKVSPLYEFAIEAHERMNAQGDVLEELDEEELKSNLLKIKEKGIDSLAIAFMHSVQNPKHELRAKELALELGFSYVSLSHQVSPKNHYISRAETAVVDAYLSPFLSQYTSDLEERLGIDNIYYMQSNAQLCASHELKGHNALLSGPAGGLIGAISATELRGIDKIITFDMGGTSSDVALYDGELSLELEPHFEGIKLLAPMVDIHTVAAGGGSILKYDDGRFIVGPESAGAFPGPACYRNGGPLTVTDANLFLGRIELDKFPKVFGENQNQGLDLEVVKRKFEDLAQESGLSAKAVAQGFLDIAVETMARAIRKISVEKGQDPREFTLVSFGGAGAQLAMKVADNLQIKKVFIHPLSSVLSAYGMGHAHYSKQVSTHADYGFEKLEKDLLSHIKFKEGDTLSKSFSMGVSGSDYEILITANDLEEAKQKFNDHHEKVFGVKTDKEIHASTITLTYSQASSLKEKELFQNAQEEKVEGAQVLSENKTAIVVESGWQGQKNENQEWIYKRTKEQNINDENEESSEAIELEIFYQKYQFIAESMGQVLKRMAHSVNIKERNDFSCAIFKEDGELIANAPHIPVHLGSMGEAVKWVIKTFGFHRIKAGETYICNHPQFGGTHLPDITLISPVFFNEDLCFWVASRGHHADVGGISPGSMPGASTSLEEEGVAIKPTLITNSSGVVDKEILRSLFMEGKYPTRNFELNFHDIQAKFAANRKGISDLVELFNKTGKNKLLINAENLLNYSDRKIQKRLSQINPIRVEKTITKDRKLVLNIKRNEGDICFDFTGTSASLDSNFNAPSPIVKASVLFSLRCLLNENIPLNDGLLRSIELILPEDSMLNPKENAAVVAGNVETSQAICDLVFEALDIKANSQGTMNNLTFGNQDFQYYETLAGGSGATATGDGASGVQVNMTNSLMTDPEVMESRFPILVDQMKLRSGSGGRGLFNGGDGIFRKLTFLKEVHVSMLSQFRMIAPKGLHGAENGKCGSNIVVVDECEEELAECFDITIPRQGHLIINTPGGGGWGKLKGKSK